MDIFTDHNQRNYRNRQAEYYRRFIARLQPLINRFPVILKGSYLIQIGIWFCLPIIILAANPKVRAAFSWKVLLVYMALFLPAGWIWNWYVAEHLRAWFFLKPLFTGVEIFGVVLGDLLFYVAGIPCFYLFNVFFEVRFADMPKTHFLRRQERVLSYLVTAAVIGVGIAGYLGFGKVGKSMFLFEYLPTIILLFIYWGRIPIPEMLGMTLVGIFMEFSWDSFATYFGFWVYENHFTGPFIWGTVPLEMVYFSFPSGLGVVLMVRLLNKVLKIENT